MSVVVVLLGACMTFAVLALGIYVVLKRNKTGTLGGGGGGAAQATGVSNCPAGWKPANGTLYSSWPAAGTVECVDYEGCKWAGMFAGLDPEGSGGQCAPGAVKMEGGNGGGKMCRFPPDKVRELRVLSVNKTQFKTLQNKKVEMFIEGRPNIKTTGTIRDYCSDKDCTDDSCNGRYRGCCSKHSDNGRYQLLDMEVNVAQDLFRGTGLDLTKADVGGPFQTKQMPAWARNMRPGLPECVGGTNTIPLCYRMVS